MAGVRKLATDRRAPSRLGEPPLPMRHDRRDGDRDVAGVQADSYPVSPDRRLSGERRFAANLKEMPERLNPEPAGGD